ncbi:hypothetical protein NUW58_g6991 [Xylaria curta]|uniref:Uncharacterized protein n=1 Tax=Xylaria curta TaxID=42375 RepID=A0ACC1NMF7_9PEZI|nr:hypothetical protein NUW58_g6991 [Xylaria curta]
MKTSVVLATISAGLVAAELSPPENFPACGSTCFGNMLGQASELGCGGGGSTQDAVNGECLCKNPDFSYGIKDCANEACPQGLAPMVIQYGVNWCAEKGVIVSGLGVTPDSTAVSSPSATVSATDVSGAPGSSAASVTTSEIVSTATNSDGSVITTTVGTTTVSNTPGEGSSTVVPISTTEVVATLTNSNGDVVTTTFESTIISTSVAGTESGSSTNSGSATESTIFATESTITEGGSTQATSVTTTAPASTSNTGNGCFQTAAPIGFVAAAGLAALML